MSIGEFASLTGVSKDTIRYYEKIELLKPTIINSYRHYTDEDILSIQAIIKLKQNGFSLQEIKLLFDWTNHLDKDNKLAGHETENLQLLRELFQEKYRNLIEKEKQIIQIKEVLLRVDRKVDQLLGGKRDETTTN
ncbi:MAG: MerR family transcriptional regulator [Psychrobacillus sp.]